MIVEQPNGSHFLVCPGGIPKNACCKLDGFQKAPILHERPRSPHPSSKRQRGGEKIAAESEDFPTKTLALPLPLAFIILAASVLVSFSLGKPARHRLFYPVLNDEEGWPAEEFHISPFNSDPLHPGRSRWSESLKRRNLAETARYEALVHPAMFVLEHPKRIAILNENSCDENPLLLEVLKHKNVEEVTVVLTGDVMRQGTCSDWIADSPAGNVRVTYISTLGFSNSHDQVSDSANVKPGSFDAILIDTREPYLLNDGSLLDILTGALVEDGVMVVSKTNTRNDKFSVQGIVLANLQQQGIFEHLMEYEHGSEESFIIAMKNSDQQAYWHMNEAEWNISIRNRLFLDSEGNIPLHFFDSATMMGYQFPSRLAQELWCAENAEKCFGKGFDPAVDNIPNSLFEVKRSLELGGGRGVFSKGFVPKGSYIGLEECVENIFLPAWTHYRIHSLKDSVAGLGVMATYIRAYGWVDLFYGEKTSAVDPGIMTFVNHGCGGSYNTGPTTPYTELNFKDTNTAGTDGDVDDVYNPYIQRHSAFGDCSNSLILSDIQAEEEVLCNYLVLYDGENQWEAIETVKSMCSGERPGDVTSYELESSMSKNESSGKLREKTIS